VAHTFEPDPCLRGLAARAADDAAVPVKAGEAVAKGFRGIICFAVAR
jgi:hypothetical protein